MGMTVSAVDVSIDAGRQPICSNCNSMRNSKTWCLLLVLQCISTRVVAAVASVRDVCETPSETNSVSADPNFVPAAGASLIGATDSSLQITSPIVDSAAASQQPEASPKHYEQMTVDEKKEYINRVHLQVQKLDAAVSDAQKDSEGVGDELPEPVRELKNKLRDNMAKQKQLKRAFYHWVDIGNLDLLKNGIEFLLEHTQDFDESKLAGELDGIASGDFDVDDFGNSLNSDAKKVEAAKLRGLVGRVVRSSFDSATENITQISQQTRLAQKVAAAAAAARKYDSDEELCEWQHNLDLIRKDAHTTDSKDDHPDSGVDSLDLQCIDGGSETPGAGNGSGPAQQGGVTAEVDERPTSPDVDAFEPDCVAEVLSNQPAVLSAKVAECNLSNRSEQTAGELEREQQQTDESEFPIASKWRGCDSSLFRAQLPSMRKMLDQTKQADDEAGTVGPLTTSRSDGQPASDNSSADRAQPNDSGSPGTQTYATGGDKVDLVFDSVEDAKVARHTSDEREQSDPPVSDAAEDPDSDQLFSEWLEQQSGAPVSDAAEDPDLDQFVSEWLEQRDPSHKSSGSDRLLSESRSATAALEPAGADGGRDVLNASSRGNAETSTSSAALDPAIESGQQIPAEIKNGDHTDINNGDAEQEDDAAGDVEEANIDLMPRQAAGSSPEVLSRQPPVHGRAESHNEDDTANPSPPTTGSPPEVPAGARPSNQDDNADQSSQPSDDDVEHLDPDPDHLSGGRHVVSANPPRRIVVPANPARRIVVRRESIPNNATGNLRSPGRDSHVTSSAEDDEDPDLEGNAEPKPKSPPSGLRSPTSTISTDAAASPDNGPPGKNRGKAAKPVGKSPDSAVGLMCKTILEVTSKCTQAESHADLIDILQHTLLPAVIKFYGSFPENVDTELLGASFVEISTLSESDKQTIWNLLRKLSKKLKIAIQRTAGTRTEGSSERLQNVCQQIDSKLVFACPDDTGSSVLEAAVDRGRATALPWWSWALIGVGALLLVSGVVFLVYIYCYSSSRRAVLPPAMQDHIDGCATAKQRLSGSTQENAHSGDRTPPMDEEYHTNDGSSLFSAAR